jgi:deoxyribodipyrimidine photo-lyase
MKARTPSTTATIVWFRNDLRMADNPALRAAVQRGPVVPVFIWSPEEEGRWKPGGASKWWLHRSLQALGESLAKLGTPLILRKGPSLDCLNQLLNESGASAIYWNRRYEPALAQRDAEITTALEQRGVHVETFNGSLLFEPGKVLNKSGKPFQVFTPFWKTCLSLNAPSDPLPAPRKLAGMDRLPKSLSLDTLELEPTIPWAKGFEPVWTPGETSAVATLRRFCSGAFLHYSEGRNRPDLPGTSRLSPHLHFGEISARQVWHGLRRWCEQQGHPTPIWHGSQFLAEIGWREFAYQLLHHFPHTPAEPLRPEFARFPWHKDPLALKAWQRGRTGYPLVDAGMRQVWATGWMHNRVRMVVASFLVKDLLIPWQLGANWFWDTLVDADLANNTLGWQWTAGCGADAAPFFRIFNPTSQGAKFDPKGDYVRQWVPELAKMPTKWIHEPWAAPEQVLREAGLQIGRNYPERIINHSTARNVALEAYGKIKANPI